MAYVYRIFKILHIEIDKKDDGFGKCPKDSHLCKKKVCVIRKKVINIKHSVYYINFNDGFGAGKCPKDNSAKKLIHLKN
jgi:hypothetical protein